MNDKIYPSMVIRSQAEAIELLEKENKKLLEENEELKLIRSTCAFCPYYTENKELKEKYLNAVADYEETKSEWQELHNKIDKAIEILNNPWSFESGNKEVDEITYQKKREIIETLKDNE